MLTWTSKWTTTRKDLDHDKYVSFFGFIEGGEYGVFKRPLSLDIPAQRLGVGVFFFRFSDPLGAWVGVYGQQEGNFWTFLI